MSMFDNVIFDEYSLLEGKQAEEYKARKAKEAADREKAEEERNSRRYGDPKYTRLIGRDEVGRSSKPYSNYGTDEEMDRRIKTYDIIEKEMNTRCDKELEAMDKHNSHVNQHPGKRPTGIFKGKEKKKYDEKLTDYNKKEKELKKDFEDKRKALRRVHDTNARYNDDIVYDATNRHIRRQEKRNNSKAKHESVLAMIESYECEYNY